jgi:hypothetical protein
MNSPDIKGFILLAIVCVLLYVFSPAIRAETWTTIVSLSPPGGVVTTSCHMSASAQS